MRKHLMLLGIFCLSAIGASGDTIYFKSGKSYSCKVAGFSDGAFIIEMDGQTNQAPAANVDRVEFSDSAMAVNPAVPSAAPTQKPKMQKYTVASYLEGKTYGDPVDTITIKEVEGKIFSIDNKPIKLTFNYRGNIVQTATNTYYCVLIGEDYQELVAYFDSQSLKYLTAVSDKGNYDKTYSLYGIILSPKTMDTFSKEYSYKVYIHGITQLPFHMTSGFLPLGRSMKKARGLMPASYSWD